ncbi:SDR family NAD(P)-dependent oxidoreductase, partial [Micromonospora sp. NBS 11-29]|uniref:SDR family NAD(P)-dependent oxidoreductase n=1 Tax=Micromonospora sp. NBS 11-29 TaxID=1960879 RepID=UPI0020CF1BB7
LDRDVDAEVLSVLAGVLADLPATGGQVAVRDALVWTPRLVRAALPSTGAAVSPTAGAVAAAGDPVAPGGVGDGTVLVTGGTGSLGALVAEHLVTAHGVRSLVLVSRQGPAAPGADVLVERLTGLGASASVVACDVTDRGQVARLVGGVEGRLAGVVHTAGVLDDGVVSAIS